MASKQLIEELATEICCWSKAELYRALGERDNITTKQEALEYLHHYAGYELEHLRRSLGTQRGVSMKKIQELQQIIQEKDQQIQELNAKMKNYEIRLTRIEARLQAMENQRVRDRNF